MHRLYLQISRHNSAVRIVSWSVCADEQVDQELHHLPGMAFTDHVHMTSLIWAHCRLMDMWDIILHYSRQCRSWFDSHCCSGWYGSSLSAYWMWHIFPSAVTRLKVHSDIQSGLRATLSDSFETNPAPKALNCGPQCRCRLGCMA